MIEVREIEKGWGLFVGEDLIGTSKNRSDADFAKRVLEKHFRAQTGSVIS